MDTSFVSAAAPGPGTASPGPAAAAGRARAFGDFKWWPRAPETTPVPWWVHALLLFVLLGIDVLLYYATLLGPKSNVRIDLVWYVRNGALDALTAALFYWNWAVLFPRTLAHGRMDRYLLAAAASAAGFTLLRMATSNLVYYALSTNDPDLSTHFGMLFTMLWVGNLVTVAASSGLRIALDYLHSQRQRRELERQHLLTELAMLKTQINPHFLFNTLNNIYSLTSRKSDRAPEAVLRLAESMRYLLYESSADTVPLSQELAHLRSFLDLQRLRLPQAEAEAAIVLHLFGSADLVFPVAPLLLLPLVENAFKHGDLAARPEAIRIELELLGEDLHFSVHNYVAAATDLPHQPGGLGLHNLRRRLELLYPGRHALHVRTLPGEYAVELVLHGEAKRLTAPRRA
ncbi:sensor histidine kinase [Hymenobacter sp. IS2118]|uniref:sensor histidine kinase n=1 Tax=Hymenobacter sp. IS2118 TaxID=1505605 RepID=UPI0006910311|nr:sensor histidine kinase [Hymenobacter sp. IS2118]